MKSKLTNDTILHLIYPYLESGSSVCLINEVLPQIAKIKKTDDWNNKWLEIASFAYSQKRFLHAAYYYYMASILIEDYNPKKSRLYEKSLELFYKGFDSMKIHYEFCDVNLESGTLTCVKFPADEPKYDIIFCCDYWYFAELYVADLLEFTKHGYNLYFCDAPGQGGAINKFIYAQPEYESFISKLLDALDIQECCLFSYNFGCYCAMRGAAFDKRIKQVALFNPIVNYSDIMKHCYSSWGYTVLELCEQTKQCCLLNYLSPMFRNDNICQTLFINHLKYINDYSNDYEYFCGLKKYNLKGIESNITQDLLLITDQPHAHTVYEQIKYIESECTSVHSLSTHCLHTPHDDFYSLPHGLFTKPVNICIDWLDRLINK